MYGAVRQSAGDLRRAMTSASLFRHRAIPAAFGRDLDGRCKPRGDRRGVVVGLISPQKWIIRVAAAMSDILTETLLSTLQYDSQSPQTASPEIRPRRTARDEKVEPA